MGTLMGAFADVGIDDKFIKQVRRQLAELHDAGLLSDEEFAAAKQKVLAGG
jgi:uncharacterized membrane protein